MWWCAQVCFDCEAKTQILRFAAVAVSSAVSTLLHMSQYCATRAKLLQYIAEGISDSKLVGHPKQLLKCCLGASHPSNMSATVSASVARFNHVLGQLKQQFIDFFCHFAKFDKYRHVATFAYRKICAHLAFCPCVGGWGVRGGDWGRTSCAPGKRPPLDKGPSGEPAGAKFCFEGHVSVPSTETKENSLS